MARGALWEQTHNAFLLHSVKVRSFTAYSLGAPTRHQARHCPKQLSALRETLRPWPSTLVATNHRRPLRT